MNRLKDIYISRRALLLLGAQTALLVLQFAAFTKVGLATFEDACMKIFFFGAVNIILQITSLLMLGRLISLGGLFIPVTYLVNLSYVTLIAFHAQGPSSALTVLYLSRYGQYTFLKASIYALNTVCFVFLGYLLFSIFTFTMQDTASEDSATANISLSQILSIGKPSSVLFGLIYFISISYQLMFSFTHQSYVDLASITRTPLLNTAINLQPFFFAGLYLLMVYYKLDDRMNISRRLLLFAIFSLVISFFTGSRSRGMMMLLVLLILWEKTIEKISPRTFWACLLWGVVLLQLLYSIRSVRGHELTFENWAIAFFSMKDNIIYETLNEFGASICATAGLMNVTMTARPADFLIKEVGSILPNVSTWGGAAFQIPVDREGIEQLYHMGSTFVGDLYFYFGEAGQYLAMFIGAWIAGLDNFIESRRNAGRYWGIAIAIPGLYTVFNSSRASISLGLKMFLYSFVIFSILKAIFRVRNGNKGLHGDERAYLGGAV